MVESLNTAINHCPTRVSNFASNITFASTHTSLVCFPFYCIALYLNVLSTRVINLLMNADYLLYRYPRVLVLEVDGEIA